MSVIVNTATGAAPAVTVPVLGAQPGIFILDGASSGATHAPDGSIAGASNPASRGETLVLYLAGLGPVDNPPASRAGASLTTLSPTIIKPQVTIGGFDAAVVFSGLTPGYIGLYQVNATVPVAVALGLVDVTVLSNGVTSNVAKIAIH